MIIIKNKGFKFIRYNNKKTRYVIFKDGTVMNYDTGHIMKQSLNVNGYLSVKLTVTKNYKSKEFLVHRLLAEAFIKNPYHKPIVHHINRNKLDNSLKNLLWVTEEEHKQIHSTDEKHPYGKGEHHHNAILKDYQVKEICALLESGDYTQRKIAKMYNVPEYIIHEIRLGHNWTHISKDYDFSNVKGTYKYTPEIIRNIAEDIKNDIGTLSFIAEKEGVPYDVVLRVYTKKYKYKVYNLGDYDFSNFSHHRNKYSYELIEAIDNLVVDKYSAKDICDKLNLKYIPATIQLIQRRRNIIKNKSDD